MSTPPKIPTHIYVFFDKKGAFYPREIGRQPTRFDSPEEYDAFMLKHKQEVSMTGDKPVTVGPWKKYKGVVAQTEEQWATTKEMPGIERLSELPKRFKEGAYVSELLLERGKEYIAFRSTLYRVGLYGVVTDSEGSYVQNAYDKATRTTSWAKKLIEKAVKEGFKLTEIILKDWEAEQALLK